MQKEEILNYYSRDDVLEAMLDFSQHREVVARFQDGSFGKRPNTLLHKMDIIKQVEEGAVSFHSSVELWINPLSLDTSKRMGWDLLFDIDSSNLEYSKKAAKTIIEAINEHEVESIYLKFSGRAGFHIFIPDKAFPEQYKDLFPDIPRAIGAYIWDLVKDELPKAVRRETKIDSIAISPRHLVRMPYSLNEKSWLVSIPVEDVDFDLEDAKPDNVKAKPFSLKAKKNEAEFLVEMAMNYIKNVEKKELKKIEEELKKEIEKKTNKKYAKLPYETFPPCIKKILEGKMRDGKKRAEFILRTFLRQAGYDWEEINAILLDWNNKNIEKLRPNYFKTQIRWHMKQTKEILPPNCDKPGFYKELGICNPDMLCKEIKNPISYALKKYKMLKSGKKIKESNAKD